MSTLRMEHEKMDDVVVKTPHWYSHIRKIGNSASVRLTQEIMTAAGMDIDQPVIMSVKRGEVVIRAEDNYEETLKAAEAFAARYPLLLDKLGD
jgi:antitoxin component of MazEF toxin-antitoxin module